MLTNFDNNNIKNIGILAITAPGASLTYRKLVESAFQNSEINGHPNITLHSINYAQYRAAKGQDNMREVWQKLLIETIEKLENAGAELIICPSNTPHQFYNDINNKIKTNWLHIVETVKEEIIQQQFNNPLLLGTKETIDSRTFEPFFEDEAINLIKPNDEEVERMNQIISDELIEDIVTTQSTEFFTSLIEKYKTLKNIDSVILGCTELPIIIDNSITNLPLVDTTQTLANYALKHAIK